MKKAGKCSRQIVELSASLENTATQRKAAISRGAICFIDRKQLSRAEEMRNRDGVSGLFFGSLPNFEELLAAKATFETNKDDEISAIQPICCR